MALLNLVGMMDGDVAIAKVVVVVLITTHFQSNQLAFFHISGLT